MACSIDGLPITIQSGSLQEGCKFQGVDVDVKLGVEGHQRQHFSFGSADTWSFVCLEDANAVDWVNSVGYLMKSKLNTGTAVVLVADFGAIHSLVANQLVYVMGLRVWYSQALKIRYIKFSVRGI